MTIAEYVEKEIADQLRMLGFQPDKAWCRVAPPRIDVKTETGAIIRFWIGVTTLNEPWPKKSKK